MTEIILTITITLPMPEPPICSNYDLLWSDKVGYVWLTIGTNPLYVDTGRWIESAADPLELAEIKRRWKIYIDQLPEYP